MPAGASAQLLGLSMPVLLALPSQSGNTAGSPVQAGSAPTQKAGSLLFSAKQDLRSANPCSVSRLLNTLLKGKLLHLGCSWELGRGSCLMDEVRGEAKDAAGLQLETSFHA